jgi:site-specific recombinase XerD
LRLPNGFGSAYKLKGNRRRPYIARITSGKTEEGMQIFKPIGYFKTKPEAILALTDYKKNPIPLKTDITLKELYDEWSKGKYEYISRQTEDCYRAAWGHLSRYGDIKFKELRTAQIQSAIDSQYKLGKSRSTLEKIKIVSVMLCSYGMQNDIINKNYAEFVHLPKTEKEEKEKFSDLEIQILEKNSAVEWVDTILILIYTGMRISELFKLTRFGVDIKNGIITGGLKTDAGKNRIIPIHDKIKPLIESWYNKNGDYLICNDKGKAMQVKKYREEYYYPALEKVGIRKLVPHCCRHTFASILSKAGADTISIQRIIGHSKYSTTADIYTRVDIEELKKAISLI